MADLQAPSGGPCSAEEPVRGMRRVPPVSEAGVVVGDGDLDAAVAGASGGGGVGGDRPRVAVSDHGGWGGDAAVLEGGADDGGACLAVACGVDRVGANPRAVAVTADGGDGDQ